MILLLLSILTNAAIYLIFKWFEIKNIRVFEAIVFNYITAFSLGMFMVDDRKGAVEAAFQWPLWSAAGILMGGIFISVFYFMAITAQKVGVSVATIASKMSLALAVILFAIFDHTEVITPIKATAIILAIAGVIFSSLKEGEGKFNWKMIGYPMLILLGSTVIDFSIAFFSTYPTNDSELALYSCLPFLTSAVIGLTIIGIKTIKGGGYHLRLRDALAGIGLGIVNYGSIFFLIKSYDLALWPKSTLLPINNLSVVIVGAIAAFLIFKEKFSKKNVIGLLLSGVALALLLI